MTDTFKSKPFSPAGKALSDRVRDKCEELEALINEITLSDQVVERHVTLALEHLEGCSMRANKAISRSA